MLPQPKIKLGTMYVFELRNYFTNQFNNSFR